MLGANAALNSVPAQSERFALDGHVAAGRNQNLVLHQVQHRHHFRNRMLHLNARVHLQEVEVALFVHQQFDGARAGVSDFLKRLDNLVADALPGLRINLGGWRLLHQLLMPALNGALALAQVDDAAVVVAQDLKLDMPGRADVLFQINIRAGKRCRRLILRGAKKMGKFGRRGNNAHAPAAASRRSLDDDGIANAFRLCQGLFLRGNHFRTR